VGEWRWIDPTQEPDMADDFGSHVPPRGWNIPTAPIGQLAPKSKQFFESDLTESLRIVCHANSRGVAAGSSDASVAYSQRNWSAALAMRDPEELSGYGMAPVLEGTGGALSQFPFLYGGFGGSDFDLISTMGVGHFTGGAPAHNLAMFGHIGTGSSEGARSGRVVVIPPGESMFVGALPVPGTLLDDDGDRMRFHLAFFRFPGAGNVVLTPQERLTRSSPPAWSGPMSAPVSLDNQNATHFMNAQDSYSPFTDTLVLDGAASMNVAAGDVMFVASGGDSSGEGCVNAASAVTVTGDDLRIDFEKDFQTQPHQGAELLFGPADEFHTHVHTLDAAMNAGHYRGLQIDAMGGYVVFFYVIVENPDVTGRIVCQAGHDGKGWGRQMDDTFRGGTFRSLPWVKWLQPDIFFMFHANQDDTGDPIEVDRVTFTGRVRAAAADSEIWWVVDPESSTASIDKLLARAAYDEQKRPDDVGVLNIGGNPKAGRHARMVNKGWYLNGPHPNFFGMVACWDILFGLDQGPAAAKTGDCNENGVADSIDLAKGTLTDVNSNNVPDECEPAESCVGDIVPQGGDGHVSVVDVTAVLSAFGQPCVAECDADIVPLPGGDGQVTIDDINAVLTAFGQCG
jgi:hypothetical protein